MADEFRIPPAHRREPGKFEPPPWEREAFEELHRKLDQAQRDDDLDAAIDLIAEEVDGVASPPAPAEVAAKTAAVVTPATEPESEAVTGAELDQARVTEMLAQLRAEEPRASDFAGLRVAVGVGMAVLGAVMIVWAMAAFLKPDGGATAKTGGTVLLLFGAGFIGGGAWTVVQVLKKRGVL